MTANEGSIIRTVRKASTMDPMCRRYGHTMTIEYFPDAKLYTCTRCGFSYKQRLLF